MSDIRPLVLWFSVHMGRATTTFIFFLLFFIDVGNDGSIRIIKENVRMTCWILMKTCFIAKKSEDDVFLVCVS